MQFYSGNGVGGPQGRANRTPSYDISMYSPAPGKLPGAGRWGNTSAPITTLYFYNGTDWSTKTTGLTDLARDFHGVSALDASNVWAVGTQGTIINGTVPAGRPQASGTSVTLRDVCALAPTTCGRWETRHRPPLQRRRMVRGELDPDLGGLLGISASGASDVWAVGGGGAILHYNGTNWAGQASGTFRHPARVSACDAGNAWAVGDGGTVLHYNGAWSSRRPAAPPWILRGVSALDAATPVRGRRHTVLKTTSGGGTWTRDPRSPSASSSTAWTPSTPPTPGRSGSGHRQGLPGVGSVRVLARLVLQRSHPARLSPFNGHDASITGGVPVSAGTWAANNLR